MAMPSPAAAPIVRHVVRDVAALFGATAGTAAVLAGLSVLVGSWA